ncbi:MAG TPA: hypothetical protein VGM36_06595 [Rhizomicrobium sp.]
MRDLSLPDLLKWLTGKHCTGIHRREEDSWEFLFNDRSSLTTSCLWRIVSKGRLALCDADDGQIFGLPARIDALAKAKLLLVGNIVRNVVIADETADLRISFENDSFLELISNSSGYEAWQAVIDDGQGQTSVVGLGGGGIAILSEKKP